MIVVFPFLVILLRRLIFLLVMRPEMISQTYRIEIMVPSWSQYLASRGVAATKDCFGC